MQLLGNFGVPRHGEAPGGDDACVAGNYAQRTAHYANLADRTELMLRGPRQVEWLHMLAGEMESIRAVLREAFAREDVALALRLAGGLDRFWQYHSHVTEGREWLARGLANDAPVPASVRAKAYSVAGWLARFQGENEEAAALLAAALALYRAENDPRGIADVTDTLGDLAHFAGNQEEARALHEENLTRREWIGDTWGMAMSLNSLGWIALERGEHDRAVTLLTRSLALVRQIGDQRGMAMALTGLGWASLDRDDPRQAQVCMRESLALFRDVGSRIDIGICLDGLASVAAMQGSPEEAARLFAAAAALREALRIDYAAITALHYARHRQTAEAQVPAECWAVAWREGYALPLDRAVEYALGIPLQLRR